MRKIALAALTLLGLFAISARAALPRHSLFPRLLPEEVYQIDDGTAENSAGLNAGGDFICLNEFPATYQPITSINVAWGNPNYPQPALNGLPYTVILWDDPNGDGQPDDANVLTTASGVVANEGTNTFLATPITPTTVATANFFVGFVINHVSSQLPAAFDEDTVLRERSFCAGGTSGDIYHLTNNEVPVDAIESFGLRGSWLIRAEAGPFGLTTVFSKKNDWEIELARDGSSVEDRSGGSENSYTIDFHFTTPLASIGGATTSCGTVTSFAYIADNPHRAEVELSGVDCNASNITVTVTDLVDTDDNTLAAASITFGLLIGDVTGNGSVDFADLREAKSHYGEVVNRGNFRAAVAAKDPTHIDISDLNLIKRQRGTRLP